MYFLSLRHLITTNEEIFVLPSMNNDPKIHCNIAFYIIKDLCLLRILSLQEFSHKKRYE